MLAGGASILSKDARHGPAEQRWSLTTRVVGGLLSLNPEDILHQADELIPNAAGRADEYLRAVVRCVREQEMPFSADVRAERLTSGWREPKTDCLVLKPTESRLGRFEMLHYAMPLGRNLKVGYYVLGAIRAQGLGGWGILGGTTQTEMDHFLTLVGLVEEFALAPAIHEIANASGFGPGGNRERRGFFGN